MLRPMAQVPGGGVGSAGGPVSSVSTRTPGDRAASRTILYPWALPQEPFPADSWAVGSDFTASFFEHRRHHRDIERDVDETTTKAVLGASVGLATPTAREFAITASGIPQRLFDNENGLRAFLEQEMRRRLDIEWDQHTVDAITAASPPSGLSGADLIAQVRNAIASHRALGASPSVLALNPSTTRARLPHHGKRQWCLRVRHPRSGCRLTCSGR